MENNKSAMLPASYEVLNVQHNGLIINSIIYLQGFLLKKGYFGFWSKYWFYMHHNTLEYFISNDPHNQHNKRLGAIDLKDFQLIEDASSTTGKRHSFGITTKFTTLFLSASDQSDLKEWIYQLKRLVRKYLFN